MTCFPASGFSFCTSRLTVCLILKSLKVLQIGITLQGARDWRCQTLFVLKWCMSRSQSLSGNVGGWNIASSCVIYNTENLLHTINILCLCILLKFLICGLSPQPSVFTCFIWFHIQILNFDKLTLLKTISWKLKFLSP